MLSERVARELRISTRRADIVVVEMFDTIVRRLCAHEPVKVKDFGKFEIRLQKGRRGRHPATGEHVSILSRLVVRFTPAKKMTNL